MTTEHVSVPHKVYENLAQISEGNMSKHDMQDLASEAYNILSRATPSDEDDGEGGNCEVCGSPVRYGSRHHRCGDAMLRAEKRGRESVQTSAPRVVTDAINSVYAAAEVDDVALTVYPRSKRAYAMLRFLAQRIREASLPVAMPDGWKLVPLVPTAEMEDAAFDTFEIDDAKTQGFNSGTEARNAIYKAMLAAAPDADAEGNGNG